MFSVFIVSKAKGFIEHIQKDEKRNKVPSLDDENPWYIHMYQDEQRCKYRGSYWSISNSACAADAYKPKDERDILEIYNVYLIKGLYTLAYALKRFCNDKFNDCDNVFQRTSSNAVSLRNITQNAEIPASDAIYDNIPAIKPIDAYGDGNAGYLVYQMQLNSRLDPIYVRIFSFFKRKSRQPDRIQPDPVGDVEFPNALRTGHTDEVIPVPCGKRCICSSDTIVDAPPESSQSAPPAPYLAVIGVLCGLLLVIVLYLIVNAIRKRRGECDLYTNSFIRINFDTLEVDYCFPFLEVAYAMKLA